MTKQAEKKHKERERAISLALGAIEKQFGKGAIMRLGEGETLVGDIPVVPTGSTTLDIALGIGGYPRDESSRCMDPSQVVKQPSHYTRSLKHRLWVAWLHSSMQNMRSM